MQKETKLKIEADFPEKFTWSDKDDVIEGELENYYFQGYKEEIEQFIGETVERTTEEGRKETGLAVSLRHDDYLNESNILMGIAWFNSDKEMQKRRIEAINEIIKTWLEQRKADLTEELKSIETTLKETPQITYDWFHCPKCGKDKAEHTEKQWAEHLETAD